LLIDNWRYFDTISAGAWGGGITVNFGRLRAAAICGALLATVVLIPAANASTLVDQGNTTLDTNTGLQWLDVSLTNDRAYTDVLANLSNPLDIVYGYRFATSSEVNQLFIDAGITAYSCQCGLALEGLISLLGPTFAPGNYEYTKGFIADTISASYQVFATVQFEGGDSGYASPSDGYLISYLDQERVGNFLVASTPLPATLPLFATGLGALGLLRWRRKKATALTA
jgi:hypothetical protein